MMELKTKYFGTIDIEQDTIITMRHPIYGFESLHQFVILSDAEIGTEIVWFQSVEEEQVCFILANVANIAPSYQPQIPVEVLETLEIKNKDDMALFTILVMEKNFIDSTANFKSPLVLNRGNNTAMQVILQEEYSLKHRIFDTKDGQ